MTTPTLDPFSIKLPGKPYVGNKATLARAISHLEVSSKSLYIHGPAGVGKSRFVTEVIRSIQKTQPSLCIHRLDFHDVHTIDQANELIASSFDYHLPDNQESLCSMQTIAQIIEHTPDALLVLDNVDYLVDVIIPQLHHCQSDTIATKLILTSRKQISHINIASLAISPLSFEDALELFTQYISAPQMTSISSEKEVTDTIYSIVKKCDGLPGVIELVAPLLRVLSPAQLLERLQLAPPHLTTETLGLIRSWELLSPVQQQCLAQLSIFPDVFAVDDVEQILTYENEPLERREVLYIIATLEALNLIHTYCGHGHTQKKLLYCLHTIRQFAATQLDLLNLKSSTRQRHVRYFLAQAEKWNALIESPQERVATETLMTQASNIEAAFRYAHANDSIARLGIVLHVIYQKKNRPNKHAEILKQALNAARATHNDSLIGQTLHAYGCYFMWQNVFDCARQYMKQGLDHANQANDMALQGQCLRNLAIIYFANNQLSLAYQTLDNAVKLAIEHQDNIGEIYARNTRGFLWLAAYDYDTSNQIPNVEYDLNQALALAKENRIPCLIALVCSSLAFYNEMSGYLNDAIYYSRRAIKHYQSHAYQRHAIDEQLKLSRVFGYRGEFQEATQLADEAKQQCQQHGFHSKYLYSLFVKGKLLFLQGQYKPALQQFLLARAPLDKSTQRLSQTILAWESAAYAMLGQRGDAQKTLQRTENIQGTAAIILQEFHLLAVALETQDPDDIQRAYDALQRLYKHRESPPHPSLDALILRYEYHFSELPGSSTQNTCQPTHLKIAQDYSWFEYNDEPRVTIARRAAMRRILQKLVENHTHTPEISLPIDAIFEVGWPGDQTTPESANSRVYVTIKRLRKLGLEDVLITTGCGYCLAKDTTIEIVP